MTNQTKLYLQTGKRLAALVLAVLMLITFYTPCSQVDAASKADKWGVFIGAKSKVTPARIKKDKYKYVVIDAQNYTASDIAKLKKSGSIIYSYLSIGSIANYRPYYKRFKKYTLGNYNNWPGEKWVNVTKKSWQDFVVNNLVASMTKKGVEGVWVDNTDVYYKYHRKSIFNGLVSILNRIHKKNIPIIINGGDVFVKQLMKTKKTKVIDGIMQEEVLTLISGYGSNSFKTQTSEDQKYFKSYIKKVKKAGLYVSLLEYTKKASKRKTIINYCKKNGFGYYICDNVMLK